MDPESVGRRPGRPNRPGAMSGLVNVDDRLRAAFGEDYGLVVETAQDAGTKVIVRLPKFAPGECPDRVIDSVQAVVVGPIMALGVNVELVGGESLVGPHAARMRGTTSASTAQHAADQSQTGSGEPCQRPASPSAAVAADRPATGLVVLAVDDEAPALDEISYLLRGDPRVGTVLTAPATPRARCECCSRTRRTADPGRGTAGHRDARLGRRRSGQGARRAAPSAGGGLPVRA